MILLMPVFPWRPQPSDLYHYALSRAMFAMDAASGDRLDLEMVAMLDDVVDRAQREWGLTVRSKVAMMGTSAAGVFTNIFALMHPERIAAAAIGFPGLVFTVPASAAEDGTPLPYPIGTADFSQLTGIEPDVDAYCRLPLYFFVGEEDTLDGVPDPRLFPDDVRATAERFYGEADAVKRWDLGEKLYAEYGCERTQFWTYPGVEHHFTPLMKDDLLDFFAIEA